MMLTEDLYLTTPMDFDNTDIGTQIERVGNANAAYVKEEDKTKMTNRSENDETMHSLQRQRQSQNTQIQTYTQTQTYTQITTTHILQQHTDYNSKPTEPLREDGEDARYTVGANTHVFFFPVTRGIEN